MIGGDERGKIFTILDKINFIRPTRREIILLCELQLKAVAEKR